MESAERRFTTLNSEQVRALAHPLRSRLLGLLRLRGASTASRLAERLGTNSGATSYHLRQLAAAGLVEERPDLGTGRERFWDSSHDGHSWRDVDFDANEDDRMAADWMLRYNHRHYARLVDAWHDQRQDWPKWRTVADQSDFVLTVTPAQLREFHDRVEALAAEYRGARTDDDTAEQVAFITYSVPYAAIPEYG